MKENHLSPHLVPLAVEVACAWNVHQHNPFWNQLRFGKSHFHQFDQGPDLCFSWSFIPASPLSPDVGVQLERQLPCLGKRVRSNTPDILPARPPWMGCDSGSSKVHWETWKAAPGQQVPGGLRSSLEGSRLRTRKDAGDQEVQAP